MNMIKRFLQAAGVRVVHQNFVSLYGPPWVKMAVAKSQESILTMVHKSGLSDKVKISAMSYGENSYDKISYFESGKERWFIQPVYNEKTGELDIRLVDYRRGTKGKSYRDSIVGNFALGTPTNTISNNLIGILLENMGKDHTRQLMATKLIEDAEFAPRQS